MLRGGPPSFGNLVEAMPGAKGTNDFSRWIGKNFDPSVNWDDFAWVRERWDGPIIIKGILDAEDARRAASVGADGIIVSNHGGRQLDGVPAGIEALPPIVSAVGDKLTVLMDGGVRSEYRPTSGGTEFYHTVVPEALGGKGIGSRLVKSVLDQMRARGTKIKPTCPFFKAFIEKHPEYQDLVIG